MTLALIALGVLFIAVLYGALRLSVRLSEPEDIRDHLTTDMDPSEAEELASEAVESTRRERRRRRNDR